MTDNIKPKMQSVDEVVNDLTKFLLPTSTDYETVSIFNAIHRTLAQDLIADADSPRFDNSAMDGYAFNYVSLPVPDENGEVTLTVIGHATAGHPFNQTITEHSAVRIMTGGQVPTGYDTVIQIEHVKSTETTVTFNPSNLRAGQNVRLQGELYKKGDVLVHKGTVFTSGMAALAAGLGLATLQFVRKPKVGVFASGDELVEPGSTEPLAAGQIYNSNGITMTLLAQEFGANATYVGILPDDPEQMKSMLSAAAEQFDIIVTSGGVGPGDRDFTFELLSQIANVEHHWAKMRPGKSIVYGRFTIGKQPLYFGLAGNPVATAVCCKVYLRKAIAHYLGQIHEQKVTTAKLIKPIKTRLGRQDFAAGVLLTDDEGTLWFDAVPTQNSSSLISLALSPNTAIVPADCEKTEAGQLLKLLD